MWSTCYTWQERNHSTCRYFFAHKNERKYFCSVTQRCFIWWNRRRWCQPRTAFCNVTSLNVSTRSSSCSRNTSWASCQHCTLTSYRNVVSSCSVIFLILIQKHKIYVHRLIEVLCLTWHKIGHFGDVVPSQSLHVVQKKKQNVIQQKQTTQKQKESKLNQKKTHKMLNKTKTNTHL